MADEYRREIIEEDLECSSSSFDESSDESDDEKDQIGSPAAQRERMGVRPYQFEPEGGEDDRGSDSENERPEQEIVGDEWFVRLIICICTLVASMWFFINIYDIYVRNYIFSRMH